MGFADAFEKAYNTTAQQSAASAGDIIKETIKNEQDKATKRYQASSINHAILAAAATSGNPDDLKKAATIVDAIGNTDPEASKLVYGSIQDQIKAKAQDAQKTQDFMLRSQGMQPIGSASEPDRSAFNKQVVEASMASNPAPSAPPTSIVNGQQYIPVGGVNTSNSIKLAAAKQKDADANNIVEGIKKGITPPDLTGLGRTGLTGAVEAKLAKQGFDLAKAKTDWTATQQFAKNLNSSQQIVMNESLDSVDKGIDPLKQLSSEVDRTGFVPANGLIIKSNLNGIELKPGLPQSQVNAATKYVTQLNLMRDQLATGMMKGGTPTDKALELTDAILKPAYGKGQIGAALDQVRFDINIRKNAISSLQPQLVGGQQGQQSQQNQPPSYDPRTQKLQQNSKGQYRVVPK